jgi:hypothetical protein
MTRVIEGVICCGYEYHLDRIAPPLGPHHHTPHGLTPAPVLASLINSSYHGLGLTSLSSTRVVSTAESTVMGVSLSFTT